MINGSDPILLTPGPLTTSPATRQAMLRDWGSWDAAFNRMTSEICRDLLAIVSGQKDFVCVPMQGSGTFSVEAALGSLVPRDAVVLVVSEEDGTISLARGGVLTRGLEPAGVLSTLRRLPA